MTATLAHRLPTLKEALACPSDVVDELRRLAAKTANARERYFRTHAEKDLRSWLKNDRAELAVRNAWLASLGIAPSPSTAESVARLNGKGHVLDGE